jgi:hypothetical protein
MDPASKKQKTGFVPDFEAHGTSSLFCTPAASGAQSVVFSVAEVKAEPELQINDTINIDQEADSGWCSVFDLKTL